MTTQQGTIEDQSRPRRPLGGRCVSLGVALAVVGSIWGGVVAAPAATARPIDIELATTAGVGSASARTGSTAAGTASTSAATEARMTRGASSASTPGPTGKATAGPTTTCYWTNYVQPVGMRLREVPRTCDIVPLAFAGATGRPGEVTFSVEKGLSNALGGYSDSDLAADVRELHARGTKVVLSIGGAAETISVRDEASARGLATSALRVIRQLGLDGVDIDLEQGFSTPHLASAMRRLAADVGDGFVLTMAPQTYEMVNRTDRYADLALRLKDIVTKVNVQFYNSGTMYGCDGGIYTQGTVDFLTALACRYEQHGLRPDQIGLGVPARPDAAGGGYVDPSTLRRALTCLESAVGCGSFTPPTRFTVGGTMMWSINYDRTTGFAFANVLSASGLAPSGR
ncbi:MAG: glycosyl hydrolase family 18 protein [Dermatophilaceae bacterium]